MKLFFYYAAHSFVNQIKKLFKTWIAVFVGICILVGVVAGLAGSFLDNLKGEDEPEQEEQTEQEERDPERTAEILELVIGGVTLALLLYSCVVADKSGSKTFQMADVNLLFPSPMKPQSVLLFRVCANLGAMLAASLYMIFQIPNLTFNVGLGLPAALCLLVCWFFMLAYSQMLTVFIYTLSATHEWLHKYIRPLCYAVVFTLAASFIAFWKLRGLSVFDALIAFFNSGVSRLIPVWGWIKGFEMYLVERDYLYSLLCLLGLIVLALALIRGIWSIKADFYEEALAGSSEVAERTRAAAEGKTVRRKKERGDAVRRDGLLRGSGANVFFYKAMYNRFRFAKLKILTKTGILYLAAAAVASAIMIYADFRQFYIIVFVLGGLTFFRALGNPIMEDTQRDYIYLIPDGAGRKLFFSMLGGTVGTVMDLLPAYVLSAILLRADFTDAVLWFLFLPTLDFYCTGVGVFMDLSIPTSAGKNIKMMIQMMFIYFGLFPVIVLVAAGSILGKFSLFILFAILFDLAVGLIFFSLSPKYIRYGRK